MKSDEPFTTRTVAVSTLLSFFVLLAMVYLGAETATAWLLAALLNVMLFISAGVLLQWKSRRGTKTPQSA